MQIDIRDTNEKKCKIKSKGSGKASLDIISEFGDPFISLKWFEPVTSIWRAD